MVYFYVTSNLLHMLHIGGITLAVSWTATFAEHISCLYLLWVQKHVAELAQTQTEL
jgi:hypothetical protein